MNSPTKQQLPDKIQARIRKTASDKTRAEETIRRFNLAVDHGFLKITPEVELTDTQFALEVAIIEWKLLKLIRGDYDITEV